MRIRLLGTRFLNFKSENGEIKGTQLFISYRRDGVLGEITDKIFVKDGFALPSELAPGQTLDIFCDTKGHVEHIQIVSAPAQAAPAK